MSKRKQAVRIACAVWLAILLAAVCAAQEFRGSISGTITDATGAAVSGAKVIVTESNTGTKAETVSDAAGHYNVPFLLPGDYEVTVNIAGFKEFVRKGFHLGAGETPIV